MEQSRQLRISIIVPSFNQAEYLPATLDSIFSQDYAVHEVIVADGASTDGSVDVIKQYAARFPALQWLSEPDDGPADAVNKGLARVTGDVIGIQNSDDIYYPGAFRMIADALDKHPECGFVYGDLERIDGRGDYMYDVRFPDFSWEAYFGVAISFIQSSIFFRTSVAQETGGWNGDYYCCDLDYWLRLLFRTRAVHVPYALSAWRRYEGQRTQENTFQKIWDDHWRLIDESPDLAASSPRMRRLAQASKHLRVMRSPPSRSRLFIARHLLIAFIKHPGFWRYNPRHMLLGWLPGYKVPRAVFRVFRKLLGMDPDHRQHRPAPSADPE